jgi:tRNA nucleotidyltransferase (CCA-adding enzyme)
MIKLTNEVNKIIKRLESEDFETYAVGGCVRDSLLGISPSDWDIATAAKMEKILEIFPEAKILSKKFGVAQLTFAEGNVDISTFRIEGPYSDHRRPDEVEFVTSIEEDLKRRDFTINAIADNPERSIVDPFGGREDLKARLIRTVGNPVERFEEDPLRILRAVRLAAELDFDLDKSVYEGILKRKDLIGGLSKERIRTEFEKIIISKNAGKGLRMLAGTQIMQYIVGPERSEKMSKREIENFNIVADNIDKTMQVLDRRLGLFYTIFDANRGLKAFNLLEYDGVMEQKIADAILVLSQLYFLSNKYDFKRFLIKYGMDRYEYLNGLSKAQKIVYDQDEVKIVARAHIYDDIRNFKEPIFIEDLAIDGNDLIEAGIAEGEKIGKILLMLVDVVHMKPNLNTKSELMKYAKQFSKSRIAASFRKIKWVK